MPREVLMNGTARVAALVALLLPLAGCRDEKPSAAPWLVMDAQPQRIRPDGMQTTLRLTLMHPSAPGHAGVRITTTCGQTTSSVGLERGVGRATFTCDAARSACCLGPTAVVTATWGELTATTTLALDPDAPDWHPSQAWNPAAPGTGSGAPQWTDAAPFDPDGVLLWGTLSEGACYMDAIAHLGAPERPSVGFTCGPSPFSRPRVDPSGTIVYLESTGTTDRLHRFGRDAMTWDADFDHWSYPSDPLANDVVVATPACPDQVGWHWVMQAGTGEILYPCVTASTAQYYDAQGNVRISNGYRAYAWNAQDAILALDGERAVVLDPFRVELPIAGMPETGSPGVRFVTARATAAGFRAVVARDDLDPPVLQAWAISGTGAATLEGAYPDVPAGHQGFTSDAVLDAAGALYHEGSSTTEVFVDVVVKRAIGAAAGEIVYTEADAPTGDSLFTYIHISRLVTGP
jgi:hypothetical protein